MWLIKLDDDTVLFFSCVDVQILLKLDSLRQVIGSVRGDGRLKSVLEIESLVQVGLNELVHVSCVEFHTGLGELMLAGAHEVTPLISGPECSYFTL